MISIDLSGKTALVTGATGQLGRVIVRRLGQAGANVAVHYRGNREKADELCRELQAMGRRATPVQADVTDLSSVLQMRDEVNAALGMPQIVVAAAVIQYDTWTDILHQPTEDFRSQFESCVLHNVNLAKAFVPAMMEAGYGRYIGINTECSRLCKPGQAAYASAKSGMDTLLRILAKEAGGSGVTVNQVAPGWMISEKYRDAPADDEAYAASLPLKRRGTDENIADAVLFFASELSSYITGVYLPVSGGSVML